MRRHEQQQTKLPLLFWRLRAMQKIIRRHNGSEPTQKPLPAKCVALFRERVPGVSMFLRLNLSGTTAKDAAKIVRVPFGTIGRRSRDFLAHGLAGLIPRPHRPSLHRSESAPFRFDGTRAQRMAEKRLLPVITYVAFRYNGATGEQAAKGLPLDGPTLHALGFLFLKYGKDGLAPDWKRRVKWKRELQAFEITPAVADEVEKVSGLLGSVHAGWKAYARSKDCPWRLALFLRKRKFKPTPAMLACVRLHPVRAKAWRGQSRIYVHAGSRTAVLERNC